MYQKTRGMIGIGKNTSPTVKPPPCPKLFDTSWITKMAMMKSASHPR